MNELAINKLDMIDVLQDDNLFNRIERIANVMAKGVSTVPRHLQGNPSDCMAVIMQATRWGMDPFAVAQKTHLVNGTLGYEAQLVSAVIRGFLSDVPHYEWNGPWDQALGKEIPKDLETKLTVTVSVMIKGNTEPKSLTLAMAQASVRNSLLWKSDPKQQLAYLAIKRLARLYLPGAILGVYTPDELEDIREVDMGSIQPETRTETVREKLERKVKDTQQEEIEAWTNTVQSCTDLAELEAIGQDIKGQLKSVQEALRKPYTDSLQRLRTEYEATLDPGKILKTIETADSQDVLDDCADMIRHTDKRKHPWRDIHEAIQIRQAEMASEAE